VLPVKGGDEYLREGFIMATSKKDSAAAAPKKSAKTKSVAVKRGKKSITISIDLNALDKLYKRRYEVVLDGGDTKGGKVSIRDGDTKGGVTIRDGDTKGGRERLPGRKSPSTKTPAKKVPRKKA
jgi:hypothetical protein